ncbi:hypothetical protein BU16DRAFT_540160 [Lophium mytilinum]|uniref:Uncharacterized protein n=1 Tax=Lophium mytilinum TaxID=390894 RepID=A0A6A6QR90_9PEZI|nr:hypothetical protein BU16DRAFT_540160 [Lophium mytilinum]
MVTFAKRGGGGGGGRGSRTPRPRRLPKPKAALGTSALRPRARPKAGKKKEEPEEEPEEEEPEEEEPEKDREASPSLFVTCSERSDSEDERLVMPEDLVTEPTVESLSVEMTEMEEEILGLRETIKDKDEAHSEAYSKMELKIAALEAENQALQEETPFEGPQTIQMRHTWISPRVRNDHEAKAVWINLRYQRTQIKRIQSSKAAEQRKGKATAERLSEAYGTIHSLQGGLAQANGKVGHLETRVACSEREMITMAENIARMAEILAQK